MCWCMLVRRNDSNLAKTKRKAEFTTATMNKYQCFYLKNTRECEKNLNDGSRKYFSRFEIPERKRRAIRSNWKGVCVRTNPRSEEREPFNYFSNRAAFSGGGRVASAA